jgi:peptidoglycan/LPS O-acetylase OafA/YrhL
MRSVALDVGFNNSPCAARSGRDGGDRMSTTRPSMRIEAVDALRGVAAVLVLLFHYTARYDELYRHTAQAPFTLSWGHLGVQLFFMISGFVIFMTLDRTKSPADFVVSRFSRLYPAYWCAVLLTFGVQSLLWIDAKLASATTVAMNMLMFHGLFGYASVDGVYWTLEVELLFYLLMFAAWLLGGLRRPAVFIASWVGLALLSALASKLLGFAVPYTVGRFLILPYIAYFAIGMACYLYRRHDAPTRDLLWKIGVLVGLALVTIGVQSGVDRVIWAIGFLALLAYALSPAPKLLLHPLLLWLGALSYPLYLVHQEIGYLVIRHLQLAGISALLSIVAMAVLAVGLASAIHYFVEMPAMRAIRSAYAKRNRTALSQSFSRLSWLLGLAAVSGMLLLGNRLAVAQP